MMNTTFLPNGCASLKGRRRTTFFIFAMVALGGLLVGYSDRTAAADIRAPSAGSCNNAPMGFCNEFTGSSYKAARVQRSCEMQKVQYLPGACPSEGRVGACVVYKGKNSESNYIYYTNFPGMRLRGGVTVAAEAAKQCVQMKGEWHSN